MFTLKEIKTVTYKNLGEVKTVIVQGPKKEYAFFKYENGRIHQIKACEFAKHEQMEAFQIAKEA